MKRPGNPMATYTTPASQQLVELLGGERQGDVTLSNDEMSHLRKLYGFQEEPVNERPPKPAAPPSLPPNSSWEARRAHEDATRAYEAALAAWERWRDPRVMMQAGADRNMLRHATSDGLRMVAWLARFCEAGQDPLKLLVELTVRAGYDVDFADVNWADAIGLEPDPASER